MGLALALLLTPLMYQLIQESTPKLPCQGILFPWINSMILIISFPVISWAVVGLMRFMRKEQRHFGSLGIVNQTGHLSFVLPGVIFLPIIIGGIYLVPVGATILLLLVIIAFGTTRSSLTVHLIITLGNIVCGVIALLSVLLIRFLNFMGCLL